MRHQLVALFAGGVQTNRIVDLVVFAVGHLAVEPVYGTRRGENQVLDFKVAAGFQDVQEADHVALKVGVGVRDGVAHACLCGEVHHLVEFFCGKELVETFLVVDSHLCETAILVLGALYHGAVGEVVATLLDATFAETPVLETDIVIVVDVVNADYLIAAFCKHEHKLGTDKACCTCNKNFHVEKDSYFCADVHGHSLQ